MTKKRIFLFTEGFPFGSKETFLENEVKYLSQFFRIRIIPSVYPGGNTQKKTLPEAIKVENPYLPTNHFIRVLKGLFNRAPIWIFFNEFFEYKVFANYAKFKLWFIILLQARTLHRYFSDSECLQNIREDDIFYFYWGIGSANILGIKTINNKKVVRFHSGDLFATNHNGYSPLRKYILPNIDFYLPISLFNRTYLIKNDGIDTSKIFLSRLGTNDHGLNPYDNTQRCTLVSCSNVIKIKRVHLIVEVLSKIRNIEIDWYHFGNGPEINNIKNLAKGLPPSVTANFLGHRDNSEIVRFYSEVGIDLFINVSITEGIPVSIMEALSFGIPVLATNVGAVSEIVNNSCGYLIDKYFETEEIVRIIENIKTSKDYPKKRIEARSLWNSNYNADINNKKLAESLLNLE